MELVATGERLCLSSVCAAAIEPAIDRATLIDSLATLKQVIHGNVSYDAKPELFCFGLLERFDMLQLAALVAPRPVHVTNPTAAHKRELRELESLYTTLGRPPDCFR